MDCFQSKWPSSFIRMKEASQFIDAEELESRTIAFIDTGLSVDHSCFEGICIKRLSAPEIINPDDIMGHGTFFAGVLVNLFKVNGMPSPRLLSINAGGEGRLSPAFICTAVKMAIEHRVDVINIGACNTTYSPEMAQVIAEAAENGIIITAPAGNNIETEATYPASLHTVISCGSIDKNGMVAGHSNQHSKIDVFAPGSELKGPLTDAQADRIGVVLDEYGQAELSGTSFAAASVAAGALMLKCLHPEYGYAEYRALLSRLPFNNEDNRGVEGKVRLLDISLLLQGSVESEPGILCSSEASPLYWKVWSEKTTDHNYRIFGLLFDSWGDRVLDKVGHACIQLSDYNMKANQRGNVLSELSVAVREGKLEWTLCIQSQGIYLVTIQMPEEDVLEGLVMVVVPPSAPTLHIHEIEGGRQIELSGNPDDKLFYSFDQHPIMYDPGKGPLHGTKLYTHPLFLSANHQWLNYASWSKGLFSEQQRHSLTHSYNSDSEV